jgi:type I restriction enzyme S subunit
VPHGVPFYRSKEIIEKFNNQSVSTELFISKERFDEIKKKYGVPQKEDILLTSVGTLGVPCLIENEYEFYFKDGNLTWFRNIKKNTVLSQYLYYWFISKQGRQKLLESSIGSTQQALTIDGLKNIEIELPSINDQSIIVKILSDLDDKIKLNHQMNKTLEAMGQALFKRWFVDFEFPGYEKTKFINGLPQGWEEVSLTAVIDVLGGGTPSTGESSYWGAGLPFFRPKDVGSSCYVIDTEKNITLKGLGHCNSQKYPRNTVFITARGTVGKVCMAGCDMAMNQSCYAIRSKNGPAQQYYVYNLIKNLSDQLTQHAHGTVFETITTETFNRTQIAQPSQDIIETFNNHVASLYDKVLLNMIEMQNLARIRDSLLPRLMLGKIRVK